MKFIKKFEGYEKTTLSRKTKKNFLSKEDENTLREFMIKYINNKDILSKAKKLKFDDIAEYYFVYENIFEDLISDNNVNYGLGTIYYDTDRFIYNSGIKSYSSLTIRNSMNKIIDSYWISIKDNFSKILDKKLINYFGTHHDEYESNLVLYEDELSDNVKKECQWIIDHQKYNL